jgi:hypothetical protein
MQQALLTMRVPKGSGFDYLGEPTPFSFPNRNSNWGIHDLAGFKKARLLCFVFAHKSFADNTLPAPL